MNKDKLILCSFCGKEKTKREFFGVNRGKVCKNCMRIKRKERRKRLLNNLRKTGETRKRRNPKEIERDKKLEEKHKEILPEIKPLKSKRKIHFNYLTMQERQFLFGLLIKKGLGKEQIKKRINGLCKYMKNTENKLRKEIKNKKEENEIKKELNRIFKEELAKMVEEYK